MIYLSGAISPRFGRTIEQHIDVARAVYLRFVAAGVPMYCPHLEADHPDVQAIPYEDWMRYDLAVLEQCDGLLTLPNWEDSKGAIREVSHAIAVGVPVFHVEADALAFASSLPELKAPWCREAGTDGSPRFVGVSATPAPSACQPRCQPKGETRSS